MNQTMLEILFNLNRTGRHKDRKNMCWSHQHFLGGPEEKECTKLIEISRYWMQKLMENYIFQKWKTSFSRLSKMHFFYTATDLYNLTTIMKCHIFEMNENTYIVEESIVIHIWNDVRWMMRDCSRNQQKCYVDSKLKRVKERVVLL